MNSENDFISLCGQYCFRILKENPSPIIIKYKIYKNGLVNAYYDYLDTLQPVDFAYMHTGNFVKFKSELSDEDWSKILKRIFEIT